METQGLDARVFGTGRCALRLRSGQAVCRQAHPRASPSRKPLRAYMDHSRELVTIRQLFSGVLGRLCAERVTVGDQKLKIQELRFGSPERRKSRGEPKTRVPKTGTRG